MPPQEMTGMASSVRPNLRYLMGEDYDTENAFRKSGRPKLLAKEWRELIFAGIFEP